MDLAAKEGHKVKPRGRNWRSVKAFATVAARNIARSILNRLYVRVAE